MPIWALSNILLEQDGSDVTQVVYTLEPAGYGNLISQRRSSTTSFYLFDALGSTRMLTNSAGSSTDTYNFKAFGETYSSSGSTTNVFRWVGRLGYYYDLDRLAYYLRARPYSPKLARFLSYDPIGVAGGLNLFGYVECEPVGLADPTGLAADSLSQAVKKCMEKPTIALQVECLDNLTGTRLGDEATELARCTAYHMAYKQLENGCAKCYPCMPIADAVTGSACWGSVLILRRKFLNLNCDKIYPFGRKPPQVSQKGHMFYLAFVAANQTTCTLAAANRRGCANAVVLTECVEVVSPGIFD